MMGRLQPTNVMPPNSVRRADRAKQARETINKAIPDLLRSSPKARHGVHNAQLVTDPQPNLDMIQQTHEANIRIRLQCTDTLTAARRLTQFSRRASLAAGSAKCSSNGKGQPNVCVLNMASPLRPGGGFLDGATSQEEFLCMRTTIYPSLWDDFYRLPEVGGIMTPDVLVFRDSTPEAEDLQKRERFFVDVISSGMLRFPETNSASKAQKDGEERAGCSCGVSYCDRDRELVTRKMRAVLRMAQSRGAERLVLGAWGCGAYGNPVKEVAKIWKKVICGTQRKTENWTGIKEVVFAINDRATLREFERCFGDVLSDSDETVSPPPEVQQASIAQNENSDELAELVTKIQETEMQLEQITNPRSKARLRDVLSGLNKQLAQIGSATSPDNEFLLEEEIEEDFVVDGFPSSDQEDSGYYNFDEDDVASSASSSPTASSLYEFRFRGNGGDADTTSPRYQVSAHTRQSSFDSEAFDRRQLDESSGWFAGSINNLSALLSKPRRIEGSPVLRPDSMGNDIEPLNLESYLTRYSSQEG